jgi:phospholipase/carboxylesterase
MTSSPLQSVEAYVVPLLRTLEALTWIARHLHPIGYSHLLRDAGLSGDELRAARAMPPWSPPYSAFRPLLDSVADLTLSAVDGLFEAAAPPEDLQRAWRAFRDFPRALETLYPLAGILPPVSRFFLDPSHHDDAPLQRSLLKQPAPPNTGVMCFGDDPDARESVWAYVPESYDPAVPHPLIVALHGGSGRGRAFLWSWVRAARTRGAIVIAPTSLGQTWAIQGRDPDSPNLAVIVDFVRQKWTVDPTRILLTGMSDGGTFTYTSGLTSESPFTHLAPVAAAFHPMLVAMADGRRMRDLPIHITHGARDWMFPIAMAEEAARHFKAAGAKVTYRPIDDLSHTYGADLSTMILDWLLA